MVLTENDKIKGQASISFAQETIEIHKKLLEIYKRGPHHEKLAKASTIIPCSIELMERFPSSTYGILQEGSKTHHQMKNMFCNATWETIKGHHKRLNELYILASENAYKKISLPYYMATQELLISLWFSNLTNLHSDIPTYSKEITAAKLFFIVKFLNDMHQDPSNTYGVLENLKTMMWFRRESTQNQKSSTDLLEAFYKEIKRPGMLN